MSDPQQAHSKCTKSKFISGVAILAIIKNNKVVPKMTNIHDLFKVKDLLAAITMFTGTTSPVVGSIKSPETGMKWLECCLLKGWTGHIHEFYL
jgi:hypothetical protein